MLYNESACVFPSGPPSTLRLRVPTVLYRRVGRSLSRSPYGSQHRKERGNLSRDFFGCREELQSHQCKPPRTRSHPLSRVDLKRATKESPAGGRRGRAHLQALRLTYPAVHVTSKALTAVSQICRININTELSSY
jgi:hypothetical protein